MTAKNLGIGHGKTILNNINIEVGQGQFIAVLGGNGRGKSTFLKTIATDIPLIEGKIELYGKDLSKWERHRISEKIAAVWTHKINIGLMTVEEFIAFGRYPFTNWLAKMKAVDKKQVQNSIDLCGIDHLKNKDIQELSDGEKQKVMIARAISQNTEIIILDEPTTHLDIKNTAEVFYLLKELSVKYNKTILVSTHKVEIGLQLADEIILISKNKVGQGTADQLIENGRIQKEFQSNYLLFDKVKRSFFWK